MVPGDRRGGCDQVRQEAEAFRYSFNNPLPPTINSRNTPPSLPEPIEKLAAGCANQFFAVSLGFSCVFFFLLFLIFTHLLSSSVIVVIDTTVVVAVIIITAFTFLLKVSLDLSRLSPLHARIRVANEKICESTGELITGS